MGAPISSGQVLREACLKAVADEQDDVSAELLGADVRAVAGADHEVPFEQDHAPHVRARETPAGQIDRRGGAGGVRQVEREPAPRRDRDAIASH